ncbi:MAG TPA: RDD family protein, partial [Paludibacter sp.]
GGRSLGKIITKTKVITVDGDKPDFKTFLIRALCRFIPLESFSFLGSTDSGWHDSISRTRVVRI